MSKIEAAIQRARMLHKQAADNWASSSMDGEASAPKELGRTPKTTRKNPLTRDALKHVDIDWKVAEANRVLGRRDGPSGGHGPYRMLRTRLMQRMRSNDWRILGVTAAGEGEGKSLTALNLAMSISAEVGQDAVLLELDLRRPTTYKRLGIAPESFTSVATYLQDESTRIEDILFCSDIERLAFMLCSAPLERSSDLLASPRGVQLFKELRQKLPPKAVVIIDLPPLLSTDDALVVSAMVDAMLFVVAEGETPRSDLVEAQHVLEEINIIGTVLNKSVEKDPRKYY
jgi:protein-tyrosine kinase